MISPATSEVRKPGPSRAGRSRVFSSIEVLLWTTALVCGVVLLTDTFSARASARTADAFGNATVTSQTSASSPQATSVATTPAGSGDAVIGRLEITKLGLSVPVLANYDPASLKRGVGHVPGTAQPGGLGNLGLAGHRDTFLRPLRNVRLGMEVDVTTAQGKFRYSVDSTEIVTPDQVSVLDIHNRPELTLITCYPFAFIGAAPQRFIVHAHLLNLDPG